MDPLTNALVIVAGIVLRLAIPVGLTILAVHQLRRLDERWQAEGRAAPAQAEKPACWEVMGCAPAARSACPGYASALPCWQARRTGTGYLREECLGCTVFHRAPVPVLG